MRITSDIARRYLFGRKSSHAINLITGISISGIAIGTAALIIILSVFNGFKELLADMFDAFSPDLKITLVEGKTFTIDDGLEAQIKSIDGVADMTRSIEEIALFEYDETQKVGVIKGVEDNFSTVTAIDTTITSGSFVTQLDGIHYAVLGRGLSNMLGVNHTDGITPITVYMLLRKSKGPLAKEFKNRDIYPSGVFSVKGESDTKYLITNYDYVNDLLDYDNQSTALEVKLAADADQSEVMADLRSMLGDRYDVADRYEQNKTFLRIMNIEKWVSYLITSLMLLLIAFNLVGTLWMIVLDKRKDISILKSMGMTTSDIKSLYRQLGLMITGLGLIIGLALAVIVYILQTEVGLIHIPDGLMIMAYPIALHAIDFLIVSVTVLAIGYLASILPSRVAGKIFLSLR